MPIRVERPRRPSESIISMGRECRRTRERVTTECASETSLMNRVHDLCAAGDSADGKPAPETLRGGDQIRDDVFVLAREPCARATERGLHLVCDEEDAVRLAPFVETGRAIRARGR